MIIERQLHSDLNNFIEQISYFAAKDIAESNLTSGVVVFDNETLNLIETFCNCLHVHSAILEELRFEIQKKLFFNGWYGDISISDGNILFNNK